MATVVAVTVVVAAYPAIVGDPIVAGKNAARNPRPYLTVPSIPMGRDLRGAGMLDTRGIGVGGQ